MLVVCTGCHRTQRQAGTGEKPGYIRSGKIKKKIDALWYYGMSGNVHKTNKVQGNKVIVVSTNVTLCPQAQAISNPSFEILYQTKNYPLRKRE